MRLICIALKYCKKAICILLIMVMLFSCCGYSKPSDYMITEPIKIELLNKAEVVNWDKFDKAMSMGSRFVVIDYYTGKYFVCERHMGGFHADIETIDKEATDVVTSLYRDRDIWKHRPVLILFEDGSVYCASSFVVSHAGEDDEPFLKHISKRSSGYGAGENYDKIKGNGMDGHICIHVRNCRNHYNGKISNIHQKNIDFLEEEKLKH